MADFYDIEKIRTFLRLNNINIDDYSDEELTTFIEMQINKIEADTGRELTETFHRDIELHFKKGSKEYILRHFPVVSIQKLSVDNDIMTNFICDYETGIIKFNEPILECEVLEVEYISKESDTWIDTNIPNLLNDMLLYALSDTKLRDVSSIKEGDISINYDTSNSLHALIIKKIEKLRFKPLTRML